MTEKTTAQVLQEARALIEAGWCQGPFYRLEQGAEQYCAIGAVRRVVGTDYETFGYVRHDPAEAALSLVARRISHGTFCCAIAYNDARGRTKEQVLALFDRALADVTK